MTSISWLHLTDLHMGMRGQDHRLPNFKDRFFKDLKRIYDKCGPWDLVLFTGDLTQTGSEDEFKRVDEFLNQLWERFGNWGFNPWLLAVPGNHDLARPTTRDSIYDDAVETLTSTASWSDKRIRFWQDEGAKTREVVEEVFANYEKWWTSRILRQEKISDQGNIKLKINNEGIIPGDFACTVTKLDPDTQHEIKIGIVGLNTSFLQLKEGDYKGQLECDVRQFNKVCDLDGPEWAKKHHLCLLMTHHPVDWLTTEAQREFSGNIFSADYFALHLYGHMHEPSSRNIGIAGGLDQRLMQGCSLFGMEKWYKWENGQKIPKEDRLHGYTFGKIKLNGNQGQLILYPRIAVLLPSREKIVPDYQYFDLEDNGSGHTRPVELQLLKNDLPLSPPNEFDECSPSQVFKKLLEKYEEINDWKEQHKSWQDLCTEVFNSETSAKNLASIKDNEDVATNYFKEFRASWRNCKAKIQTLLPDFIAFLKKAIIAKKGIILLDLVKKVTAIIEQANSVNIKYIMILQIINANNQIQVRETIASSQTRKNLDLDVPDILNWQPNWQPHFNRLINALGKLEINDDQINTIESELNKLIESRAPLKLKDIKGAIGQEINIIQDQDINSLQELAQKVNLLLHNIDKYLQDSIRVFEEYLKGLKGENQ